MFNPEKPVRNGNHTYDRPGDAAPGYMTSHASATEGLRG
jgi:hypothetical protein